MNSRSFDPDRLVKRLRWFAYVVRAVGVVAVIGAVSATVAAFHAGSTAAGLFGVVEVALVAWITSAGWTTKVTMQTFAGRTFRWSARRPGRYELA